MAVSMIQKELVGEAKDLPEFLNSWIPNGACFYQRIGNMGIICCSIRLGSIGSEVSILQMPPSMYPVSDAVTSCINLTG